MNVEQALVRWAAWIKVQAQQALLPDRAALLKWIAAQGRIEPKQSPARLYRRRAPRW